jgi:transcriptional regulator with XRE-family HTH domain
MEIDREQLRDWLRAVLLHLGWSGSDLAKRIDRVPSTINRFLNDPDATHSLSARTIKEIESATGFAPFVFPGAGRARGFTEADAAPFSYGVTGDAGIDAAVRAAAMGANAVDPWVLRSRALESAGFLPGDVLLVGMNERPRPHDVVCAQVYDWTAGKAETIFRIYEPPYLVAASSAIDLMKPLVVDDERVIIKGVMLQSFRPRRSITN